MREINVYDPFDPSKMSKSIGNHIVVVKISDNDFGKKIEDYKKSESLHRRNPKWDETFGSGDHFTKPFGCGKHYYIICHHGLPFEHKTESNFLSVFASANYKKHLTKIQQQALEKIYLYSKIMKIPIEEYSPLNQNISIAKPHFTNVLNSLQLSEDRRGYILDGFHDAKKSQQFVCKKPDGKFYLVGDQTGIKMHVPFLIDKETKKNFIKNDYTQTELEQVFNK